MLKKIHTLTSYLAFGFIGLFFTSTLLVELFGSNQNIALVKIWIFYTIPLLALSMMGAGISGFKLSKNFTNNPLIKKKQKRMPFIAANGILILIPMACLLYTLSTEGDLGGHYYQIPASYTKDTLSTEGDLGVRFYGFQAAELIFGFINLILMYQNIKEGRRIASTAPSHQD